MGNERTAPGRPDFILSLCGEDGASSYCYSFCENGGLVGAFCGLGSEGRACYGGRSEAYTASRLCAGAFYDTFQALSPGERGMGEVAEEYCTRTERRCEEVLGACRPPAKEGAGTGRSLACTGAAVLIQARGREFRLSPVWVGDVRAYLLTPADGLIQLSADDTTAPDPLEDLFERGGLTKLLSAGTAAQLSKRDLAAGTPFVTAVATSGCFSYFSTPMEFEGLLLDSLLRASSAEEWERELREAIGRLGGGDDALVMAGYGFASFREVKECYAFRFRKLQSEYLEPLSRLDPADLPNRRSLWQSYRRGYLRA